MSSKIPNTFQSLESINPDLERLFSTPKMQLSTIFKRVRKLSKISAIGDYPLISYLLKWGHSRNVEATYSRAKIMNIVRISKFYLDEERRQAYLPKEWEVYIK